MEPVNEAVVKVVAMTVDELTDVECSVLYMQAVMWKSNNFSGKLGFEKITHLCNADGSMHDETFRAFVGVVGGRLQALKK